MNNKRMVLKVGVFVLIGLGLAAFMVMRFSKGTGFSTTYRLYLEARNAGGIIPGAGVLMAGVPIGSVSDIRLAPDGSKVTMVASIYSRYKISKDALFGIATVGFLGDRFVSVSPGPGKEGEQHPGFREEGDMVAVQEAFDITTVAQSASGLMDRLSGTVTQLNTAVQRLDRTLLGEQSLTNLTQTIANLRTVSERALDTMGEVNQFLRTNTASLSRSVTNFAAFTDKLNTVTVELQETIVTNRTELTAAVKNVGRATERADRILQGVEEGKGLAGALLHNEQMSDYTATTLSNLAVFSVNLNEKGIWGVLRKPKKK